ncbi:MAG: lipase [Leucobacter sp.]|nr:lipase [Leucobacter sp.]
MQTPAKALVVSLISLVTLSFSIAPANALPQQAVDFSEQAAVQPAGIGQNLKVSENGLETKSLDSLLDLTDYVNSGHNFDVDATIAAAKSEIGTSRATGWSAPGECVVSVGRWLDVGGADRSQAAGNPVDNYRGALRLTIEHAQPGDVVQYEHIDYPTSWVSGVHTLLITGVNSDGTFEIVQSNVPYGSGLVTLEENWVPAPPAGFQAVVWRF